LLKSALSSNNSSLFSSSDSHIEFRVLQKSLMDQLKQYAGGFGLQQRTTSVLSAGRIGDLRSAVVKATSQSQCVQNTQLFIDAIVATYSHNEDPDCGVNVNNVINDMCSLSLMLVEFVSPDVMYNGLPWPDEEFTKVTLERDLEVRRFVKLHHIIWPLFYLLASWRPSLCYCSVLLRSLFFCSMQYWSSTKIIERNQLASEDNDELQLTIHLLDVMSLSELLPSPFSHVGEILPDLLPYEISILLEDIWSYMKDNVPSPNLFIRTESGLHRRNGSCKVTSQYTNRLRLIVQNNIEKFGHFYPIILQADAL